MDFNLKSVQQEIATLDKRIARLQAKLDAAKRDRDALLRTVKYFSPAPLPKKSRHAALNVDPDEIRGKDLEQALLFIAEHNDGVIVSNQVRPVLVEAGQLRGQPNTTSHALCTWLTESPRFERTGVGRYRLVDDNDEEPAPKRQVNGSGAYAS